jgi:6-phosphogluconolactonase (cycloisomerase 2 family)
VIRQDLILRSDPPQEPSRRRFIQGASALAIAYTPLSQALSSKGRAGRGKVLAYVGTDTSAIDGSANGKGIYLFEMDPSSGQLSLIKLAAVARNPSWLCLDPSQRYLYTVNEISDFEGKNGSLSAYAVDPSNGDLRLLNTISSQGAGPAYLSVDASGKYVFVANYGDGSIAVFPVLSDGSLGAPTDTHRDKGSVGSQKPTSAPPGSFAISGHDKPHAHMIAADPGNRFVLQTDLGQDRLYVYKFAPSTGILTPAATPFVSLPTGDGPRHFTFHPNGRWLYSIQEEASTVVFLHFDPATGSMAAQQTVSTLPNGFAGTSFGSGIRVSSDGRALYAANRLHNTIAVFSIGSNGKLKWLGETPTQGDYPPQFNFDPSGNFLYVSNQRSDQITSFRIDRRTGLLSFTGQYTPVGTPTCIVFMT